ncbi:MAG: TetR/AcrR family transcriptional regulator [Lachnospiraceae bacterium]|jgi:TetR/AcrR family transcriptional regulator|nr:TetR/AcrR family transcriptional regulator [Lachnospiraceae bacterium]
MNEKFFDLKKEKQDRMINAALKVFAENGFRRASTDEMVKEAGISKGLLFHYFISKTGLYEFVFDYSVKYLMMEMTSAVNAQETDYFVIRRQMEKAKTVAMKNFPFMQIFLLRAGQEDVPEAVETVGEMAETLLRMYETILERVDFTSLHALSPERLVKIVDYILNGLLAEMVREPDFKPDTYYKEALRYLEELEQMCVLQG